MSENKFLQSLCALLGAAVLVSSVHIFLLISSAPTLELGEGKPAPREIKSFAQAVPAAAVKAEPVAAPELPPSDPDSVQMASADLPAPVSETPAGPLPEAETTTTPELAKAEAPAPESIDTESGHTFLSEPVEPENAASTPAPEPIESAAGDSEDLQPASQQQNIVAAQIGAPSKQVSDGRPVTIAHAAAPGSVPVFDAVDAKGASDDGRAEAAKAATLVVAARPEPHPPLPVRKPAVPPAPREVPPRVVAETASPRETAPRTTTEADAPRKASPSKPNWQPMSLGLAKDKPATPTASRATSAPAPKPAVSSGAYRSKVWSALARHRPRLGKPGSATVTFTIGSNGSVRSSRVSQSSGDSALDARALAAVRGTAFPAPPEGLSSSALTYAIQIYFR